MVLLGGPSCNPTYDPYDRGYELGHDGITLLHSEDGITTHFFCFKNRHDLSVTLTTQPQQTERYLTYANAAHKLIICIKLLCETFIIICPYRIQLIVNY